MLATVTAGVIAGRKAARVLSPDGAAHGRRASGTSSIFLINSFVFMLIGLQLPIVVGSWPDSARQLIGLGAGDQPDGDRGPVRLGLPGTYLPLRFSAKSARDPSSAAARASVFVVAWAGMRGAVSLAAALSLPNRSRSPSATC